MQRKLLEKDNREILLQNMRAYRNKVSHQNKSSKKIIGMSLPQKLN